MSRIIGFKCDLCKDEASMNMDKYEGEQPPRRKLQISELELTDCQKLDVCPDCKCLVINFINSIRK